MKQNINIEAEGQELILRNTNSDYVIIPKKYRTEVQGMIKDNCHGCIDSLVETLPIMADYAEDGSLYSEYLTDDDPPTKKPTKHPLDPNPDGSLPSYFKGSAENPVELNEVTVTAEAPEWLKYRREYVKNNPFNIDEYVENRFNNPVGREAIKRIDAKGWREQLKQEGLQKRQQELDEATKNGLVVGGDDILSTPGKIKSTVKDIARPIYHKYKKLTTPDYSNKGDFGAAWNAARRAGEKEFMWNNQRFDTKSDMSPEQQMKVYGITDKQRLKSNIVRDRMEDNIYDFEYDTKNPIVKMKNVILDNKKEEDYLDDIGEIPEDSKPHKDFLSLYLGKPQQYNTASISKYKPSDSKEKDKEYFSVNLERFKKHVLKHLEEDYITQGISSGKITAVKDKNGKIIPNRYVIEDIGTGLGEFTIDRGEDENGEYISYWDKWNLNPYKGIYAIKDISTIEDLSFGIGKPFDIYDRIYFKENPKYHIYQELRKELDATTDEAIKTQDPKLIEKVYDLRRAKSKLDKNYSQYSHKYIQRYYSDKELSELDVNKKNFDTLALQRELSDRGYKLPKSTKQDGSFDGIWGDEIKNALLDYQIKNKPIVDKATGLDKYSKINTK